jgi:hypothetical protein
MKKTKVLVAMAAIIVGLGTTVYAELPKNPKGSIMVGNQVYSMDYVTKNISAINQQLMNNLNALFFVDNDGNAKDIFTGSTLSEEQIILRVGNTLTNYDPYGNTTKYVAGSDNKYVDTKISDGSSNGNLILDITYKNVPTSIGMQLVTLRVRNIFGIKDATYYSITEGRTTNVGINSSNIVYLNDFVTSLSVGGSGKTITIYDSNKNPVAYGTFSLDNNSTIAVELRSTGISTDILGVSGNISSNIINNGFVAVDSDRSWIYYSNSADKDKIYKKSVDGTQDCLISDDKAKYINVVGNWVYYSNYNDGGRIYRVRIDGTQREKISNDMASCINVVGDKIYYINHSDGGKVYLMDSKGNKKISGDSAKYLNVVGNTAFYSSISSGNRLYRIRLDDPAFPSERLSDIPANYINAVSPNNIYYTSVDGKLYNNRGVKDSDYPMNIISNVVKKGSKDSAMTPVQDKITEIFVDKEGNVYYSSFIDGGRLYKADNHGNGYKISDDAVEYINVADTDSENNQNKGYIYYVKSGKMSRIPIELDGSVKGEPIKKPKLDDKVVKVNEMPLITIDDVSKFNFPDRVSAIMSDNSIKQLVVNWDKSKPSIKNGVYTYSGTVLGYGTKVNLQVAIGSGMLDPNNVQITNVVGNKDYVKVLNLEPNDIISVYDGISQKPKVAKAGQNGVAIITGLNLDPLGGSVSVTVTKKDKAEGGKLLVPYKPEAPSGFVVDAENNTINGLKAGQKYIGYLYDASVIDDSKVNWDSSGDGKPTSGKVLPIKFDIDVKIDGTVSMKQGTSDVKFENKIEGNSGSDMILRLVKPGDGVDNNSEPSEPIRISRAKIPEYVGIDYKAGVILGTDASMQFAYANDEGKNPPTDLGQWNNCKSGITPVMINSYMQVWVKIKGSGTVISSKPKAFALFAPPILTGVIEGETYSGNKKPTPTWDASNTNIKASVRIYDPNKDPLEWTEVTDSGITSGQELNIDSIEKKGGKEVFKYDVDKVYAVVLTETKTVNGRSGTAVTVVKFKVNNAEPAPAQIVIKENKGIKSAKIKLSDTEDASADIYYQVTPNWNNNFGTEVDARLQRLDKPSDIAKVLTNENYLIKDQNFSSAEQIPVRQGLTITQEGLYKMTATVKNMETGAITSTDKYFIIDRTPVEPAKIHIKDGGVLANEGIYKSVTPLIVADYTKVDAKVELIGISGFPVEVALDPTNHTTKTIDINGVYTLKVTTTNKLNGAEDSTSSVVNFTIKNDASIKDAPGVTFSFDDNMLKNSDTTMEYSLTGPSGYKQIPENGYKLTEDEIESLNPQYGIWVRYKADNDIPASVAKVIPVIKDSADKPSGITFSFTDGKCSGFATGTTSTNYQYRIDGGQWTEFNADGILKDNDKDKITAMLEVRRKAYTTTSVNHFASDPYKVNLITNNTIPNVSFASDASVDKVKLDGTEAGMQYSLDNGTTWNDCLAKSTEVNSKAGQNILVRYKGTGNTLPSASITLTIKEENIGKGVNAVVPAITTDLTDKTISTGTPVTLDATATVTDGGTVSYQWYKADNASKTNPQVISAATSATYSVPVDTAGTFYYYCVITNTNNAATGTKTAETISAVSKVVVN